MLKKLAVFCLLCTCALGLTMSSGCSEGAGDVDFEKAMDNKDKKLGAGDGKKYSDHEGGVQVD